MHSEEKTRCEEFGEYLVSHSATVREAARYFGMSKSTVCRHWRMACAAAGIEDTRSL